MHLHETLVKELEITRKERDQLLSQNDTTKAEDKTKQQGQLMQRIKQIEYLHEEISNKHKVRKRKNSPHFTINEGIKGKI